MRYGLRTERLRELLDGMTSAEIVAHVVPYYHGWQVEGEWLDAWREAVEAECDRIDEGAGMEGKREDRAEVTGDGD